MLLVALCGSHTSACLTHPVLYLCQATVWRCTCHKQAASRRLVTLHAASNVACSTSSRPLGAVGATAHDLVALLGAPCLSLLLHILVLLHPPYSKHTIIIMYCASPPVKHPYHCHHQSTHIALHPLACWREHLLGQQGHARSLFFTASAIATALARAAVTWRQSCQCASSASQERVAGRG